MVSKKHRRRQLAQASAERRAARIAARTASRRRRQIALTTLAAVLVVAGLVLWIVTHDANSDGTAAAGVGASAAAVVPTLNEVFR